MDLEVRPINHRLEKRVKTHLFLCMLAYYIKWHMMEAWRPLLFADEDQHSKQTRDPVAPAKRSTKAVEKINSRRLVGNTQLSITAAQSSDHCAKHLPEAGHGS